MSKKEEVIFDSTVDVDQTIKNVKHFLDVEYPATSKAEHLNNQFTVN